MGVEGNVSFFKTLLLIFYTVDPSPNTVYTFAVCIHEIHEDLVSYTYTRILSSWHKNAICNVLQIYHALGFHYGGCVAM